MHERLTNKAFRILWSWSWLVSVRRKVAREQPRIAFKSIKRSWVLKWRKNHHTRFIPVAQQKNSLSMPRHLDADFSATNSFTAQFHQLFSRQIKCSRNGKKKVSTAFQVSKISSSTKGELLWIANERCLFNGTVRLPSPFIFVWGLAGIEFPFLPWHRQQLVRNDKRKRGAYLFYETPRLSVSFNCAWNSAQVDPNRMFCRQQSWTVADGDWQYRCEVIKSKLDSLKLNSPSR